MVLSAMVVSSSAREYQTAVGTPLVPVVSAIRAGTAAAETKAVGMERSAFFGVTGTRAQLSTSNSAGSRPSSAKTWR